MRHRCRLREAGWAEFGYFLCYFKMVASRALDSSRIGDENRVERAMRSVSDEELRMCACHTNHSVGCIKVQIKLPVRNQNDVYIYLEMCQITVVCLVRHFACHRFNFAISEPFSSQKINSCTPCVPMFSLSVT